jgi:hypothetical protein
MSFIFQVGVSDLSTSSLLLLSQLEAVHDLLQQLSSSLNNSNNNTNSNNIQIPDSNSTFVATSCPIAVVNSSSSKTMEEEGLNDNVGLIVEENVQTVELPPNVMTPAVRNIPDILAGVPMTSPTVTSSSHLPDIIPAKRTRGGGGLRETGRSIPAPTGLEKVSAVIGQPKESPEPVTGQHRTTVRRRFRITPAASDGKRLQGCGRPVAPPLRPIWGQVGAELSIIADNLTVRGHTEVRQEAGGVVNMPLALASHRWITGSSINDEQADEEGVINDSGETTVMVVGGWHAVEVISNLLLAVMVRTVLYVCLSRLKRILY